MNKSEVKNQKSEFGNLCGRGKITLCMGEETGSNITASLMTAAALARDPRTGPVLYLNTVQPSRKLGMTIRSGIDPAFSSDKKNLRLGFITIEPGLLSGSRYYVEEQIEKMKAKTLIINSLDFASKDYRRKEELIFTVMEWLARYDLNIIIFSEMRKSLPKPGKIQRGGGVGKLAAVAEEIEIVGENDELGITNYESKGETESGRKVFNPLKGESKEIPERTEVLVDLNEENSLNRLRVNATGIINDNEPAKPTAKAKHYPMSNKNRALVNEYEKIHGKAQLPGESFREMFDRVVGMMESEKAMYLPDKIAARNERKDAVREMLSI